MTFTPEEIAEFQALHFAQFGVTIGASEAAERFSELVDLVRLIERLD
jgi:hypothetical protein